MTDEIDAPDTRHLANMAIVDEAQAEFRNPVTQVAFRAGFLMCREIMARFVEQGGDASTAASIRANWLPQLGEDPGSPARYSFDEIAEDDGKGGWISKDVSASREGSCYAWVAMHSFGLFALEPESDDLAQASESPDPLTEINRLNAQEGV